MIPAPQEVAALQRLAQLFLRNRSTEFPLQSDCKDTD
jgi:hypothetical protein